MESTAFFGALCVQNMPKKAVDRDHCFSMHPLALEYIGILVFEWKCGLDEEFEYVIVILIWRSPCSHDWQGIC